eukprot:CAMPEP_0168548496 /NCGR_PEP_ID=MMETSP0413-20121227/4592_1 /TAXON_ID=136452 /ORGANISM="Filamoeba nolandi, Strain NC-AS-23-1" /LENGTH=236 /DNA_ID=CAMNT_0008578803 /DNA_START=35 /DNA_END=745 /DNA_ORIENTATION=-
MKNTSPLKRKGLRIDIDIEDNYHSQKRFVSEQMAIELGYLSISPPNEVKFRMNSTHNTKPSPKKTHSSHSRFPSTFRHHSKPTNNNFNHNNDNTQCEYYFGTESRHTNNYSDSTFFSSLENLQSLLAGDANQNTGNDTLMEDSGSTVFRKSLINRLFVNPYNNHLIPLPPEPDNSKALVVYKPPAQVIIESILRAQQKVVDQQRQKDNLAFKKSLEELEDNMNEFYLEDMEYIEIL